MFKTSRKMFNWQNFHTSTCSQFTEEKKKKTLSIYTNFFFKNPVHSSHIKPFFFKLKKLGFKPNINTQHVQDFTQNVQLTIFSHINLFTVHTLKKKKPLSIFTHKQLLAQITQLENNWYISKCIKNLETTNKRGPMTLISCLHSPTAQAVVTED